MLAGEDKKTQCMAALPLVGELGFVFVVALAQ